VRQKQQPHQQLCNRKKVAKFLAMNKLQDKRDTIQKLIQDYPTVIGIGKLQPPNEVNRFLTMSMAEIRRMSAEECGEAAVILNQAATYIQLETNSIQADINWCEEYVAFLIAETIAGCGTQYTPFEYRQKIAIKQNDVAKQLQSILINAKARFQLLSYMPNQLRATAMAFSDLQQTKRTQR